MTTKIKVILRPEQEVDFFDEQRPTVASFTATFNYSPQTSAGFSTFPPPPAETWDEVPLGPLGPAETFVDSQRHPSEVQELFIHSVKVSLRRQQANGQTKDLLNTFTARGPSSSHLWNQIKATLGGSERTFM